MIWAIGAFVAYLAFNFQTAGNWRKILLWPFLSVWLVTLCAGCTINRQFVSSELRHPDGTVESSHTRSTTVVAGDARETLAKLAVRNGKTQSIGIAGLDTESQASGTLDALTRLLQAARPVP